MKSVAPAITRLDPFDDDDIPRMVVETPRGATVNASFRYAHSACHRATAFLEPHGDKVQVVEGLPRCLEAGWNRTEIGRAGLKPRG